MAGISARRGERDRKARPCRCHPLVIIFVLVGSALLIAGTAVIAATRGGSSSASATFDGQDYNDSNAEHKPQQLMTVALGMEERFNGIISSSSSAKKSGAKDQSSNANVDDYKYQVVFSTDCGAYQRWQSYLVFFSAMSVGQPGYVTRIASSCTDEEAKAEKEWHDEHVKGQMSDRFLLHLTPHFSKVKDENGAETGKKYDFFNKPFGMQHWMEHGKGMGIDEGTGKVNNEDAIVILLDPDHIMLRPITEDFSDGSHNFRADMGNRKVSHGHPFAQEYGYSGDWLRKVKPILDKDSPAGKVSLKEAADYYPAGPPYVATGRDFYTIVRAWTDFVPKVHSIYPHLLAEMYAYSAAAAHVNLPHQMVRTLMMSDTGNMREGWSLIDDLSREEACEFGLNIRTADRPLPGVMHYCQRYMIGKHFFGKRRLPKDFLTCANPLLYEAPPDVGSKYDYKMPPPPHKPAGEKKPLSKMQQRREAFAVCLITRTLNDAATYWKKASCPEGKANLEKTFSLWDKIDYHTSSGRR